MKFGQIIVSFITSISSMFLAERWRLETSSRLFYDFIKMTTWNLAPVSQIVQKITENYRTCLYLSTGQVW